MTIIDIANWIGLCWDIVKERLAKDYAYIRLEELRRLAIDEIYLGCRKNDVTLVIEQECRRAVCFSNGKASEAYQGFWRRLKASGAKIEAIAMDMSQAYASAVDRHLPEAIIVFRPLPRDETNARKARRPVSRTRPPSLSPGT